MSVTYKHYKGGFYAFVGFATHTETYELLVVYTKFGEARLFARPHAVWNALVLWPDGQRRPRFMPLDDLTETQERDQLCACGHPRNDHGGAPGPDPSMACYHGAPHDLDPCPCSQFRPVTPSQRGS